MRTSLSLSVLLVSSLTACGTTRSGSDGGTTDAATVDDRASSMDAPLTDAPAPLDGSTPPDGSAPLDASTDSGVPTSHPPAGSTLCGSGTFDGADARTACQLAPTIPGTLPYAQSCDSASCTGGRWEIWCPAPGSSTYLYFWAHVDGATGPAILCSVPWDGGFLPLTRYGEIGGGRYEGFTGPAGGSGDIAAAGMFLSGTPTSFDVSAQPSFGGTLDATGRLHIWIAFTPDECPDSTSHPAPEYVLGIDASWSTPDA